MLSTPDRNFGHRVAASDSDHRSGDENGGRSRRAGRRHGRSCWRHAWYGTPRKAGHVAPGHECRVRIDGPRSDLEQELAFGLWILDVADIHFASGDRALQL